MGTQLVLGLKLIQTEDGVGRVRGVIGLGSNLLADGTALRHMGQNQLQNRCLLIKTATTPWQPLQFLPFHYTHTHTHTHTPSAAGQWWTLPRAVWQQQPLTGRSFSSLAAQAQVPGVETAGVMQGTPHRKTRCWFIKITNYNSPYNISAESWSQCVAIQLRNNNNNKNKNKNKNNNNNNNNNYIYI